MNTLLRGWLKGQIHALRSLAHEVEEVIDKHCPKAAEQIIKVEYSCNAADRALDEDGITE